MNTSRKCYTIILLCAIFILVGVLILGISNPLPRIVSHNIEWSSPFESTETTTYNLGNDVSSTCITVTQNSITSVKHSDRRFFSDEQWDYILQEIDSGNIVWED